MKKTIGSVAGGVGLLLLLFTAPLTYFTVDSIFWSIGAFALGLSGVVLWLLTTDTRSTWLRSAFFYSSSLGVTLAFVAVLIALNFIVAKRAPTWDLTSKKIFSLSAQTESTLKNLKAPVKAIAFVKEAPPESVEELFKRYSALNEKFTFEFLDPRRNPDLVQRYQIRESQPAAVLISENGSHLIINLQRLAAAQIAEQELTNGLLKLEAVGTQKLYFLLGHGELPLDPAAQTEEAMMASLVQIKRILQDEGYAPEKLNLLEKGQVPADASAIVIAGARSKFAESELKMLEDYLALGGRLLYFAEAGAEPNTQELLAKYGLQVELGLVADSKVNPEQPYIVYTPFIGEHEISKVLMAQQANVVFPTTRGLTKLSADTLDDLTVTPLALTSPYAWIEQNIGENPQRDDGERNGQIILAAAMNRPVPASASGRRANETRVVVFGDSDVLTGAFGVETNRNLVLNSFAWATQQVQKITIRPPDRELSTLDLDNQKLGTIRLLAMGVLPTLLLAVGLTIWNVRRAR